MKRGAGYTELTASVIYIASSRTAFIVEPSIENQTEPGRAKLKNKQTNQQEFTSYLYHSAFMEIWTYLPVMDGGFEYFPEPFSFPS